MEEHKIIFRAGSQIWEMHLREAMETTKEEQWLSVGKIVVHFYFLLYNFLYALIFLQCSKGCWTKATAVPQFTQPLGHPWRKERG